MALLRVTRVTKVVGKFFKVFEALLGSGKL